MPVRKTMAKLDLSHVVRLLAFAAGSLCLLVGAPVWATTFKTAYTFTGASDGYGPRSGLVVGPGGDLYGATVDTVYSLSEDSKGIWKFAPILKLSPGLTSLIGTPKALYGLQSSDAGKCALSDGGCGTVIEITPPAKTGGNWPMTTIYEFKGGKDGVYPEGITLDPSGVIYGTTQEGGGSFNCGSDGGQATGCGTLFTLAKVDGKWTETVLHAFDQTDGQFPSAPPSVDAVGDVFLTTYLGGSAPVASGPRNAGQGTGTVAEYRNKRQELEEAINDLYPAFQPFFMTTDYFGPAPTPVAANELVVAGEGGGHPAECALLGNAGCGVVAVYTAPKTGTAPWKATVIHSFSQTDGAQPYGSFLADGASTLYGVTQYGGPASIACKDISNLSLGCGVIYKLTKTANSWGWDGVVHSFADVANGALPVGELVLYKGMIVGATALGGKTSGACSSSGCGVVFTITP